MRSLGYDGRDRLTSSWISGYGNESFGWDAFDRLRWRNSWSGAETFNYDGTHRLTSINGPTGTRWYGHDARGNVTGRPGFTHIFDAANRLTETPGVGRFEYDGHGRRTVTWRADGTAKVDFYTVDGNVRYKSDNREGGGTDYVYLGDQLVAEHKGPWRSARGTIYTHTDHLGTPVVRTNNLAHVYSRDRRTNFGAPLTLNPVEAEAGYTGHIEDPEQGLVYMQQRYYDPTIARFLSVDPVGPLEDPITSFGRYHYAANNPYANVDPDGRRCVVANGDSVYCMRRDIYRNFDRGAAGSTRFFGAAAMTVEYLANRDLPGVRFAGSLGAGISTEANAFLDGVSSALYSLNAKTYSQILSGSLSGAGLDAKLVNMEQTAVQAALDALPGEQRDRIIGSINSSFGARSLAESHPADRAYNRVLDGVEKGLGRAIDFGKQSDREAIGNALIKSLRSSGACTRTGTRISSC